jgi:pilus assembly protein Flp/PilA
VGRHEKTGLNAKEENTVRKLLRRIRQRKGQSLVEYALILALVAIVVIAALTTLGQSASNKMNTVSTTMEGV